MWSIGCDAMNLLILSWLSHFIPSVRFFLMTCRDVKKNNVGSLWDIGTVVLKCWWSYPKYGDRSTFGVEFKIFICLNANRCRNSCLQPFGVSSAVFAFYLSVWVPLPNRLIGCLWWWQFIWLECWDWFSRISLRKGIPISCKPWRHCE